MRPMNAMSQPQNISRQILCIEIPLRMVSNKQNVTAQAEYTNTSPLSHAKIAINQVRRKICSNISCSINIHQHIERSRTVPFKTNLFALIFPVIEVTSPFTPQPHIHN